MGSNQTNEPESFPEHTGQDMNDDHLETVKCDCCGGGNREIVYRVPEEHTYNGSHYVWNLVRCKDCGLVYLNPRPNENVIGKFYPEHYYAHEEFDSKLSRMNWLRLQGLKGKPGYRDRSSVTKRILGSIVSPLICWNIDVVVPYVENGKMLDIGCGNGERFCWMQDLGWDIYGVELDKNACLWAAKRGIKVSNTNLVEAAYPNGFFDVVILNHVLEHLHHPQLTLRECNRILRRGGLLIVDVPNFGGYDARFFRETWNSLDLPRHLYHFTEETLTNILNKSGFSAITRRNKYFYSFSEKINNLAKLKPPSSKGTALFKGLLYSAHRWKEFITHRNRSAFSVHIIVYAAASRATPQR